MKTPKMAKPKEATSRYNQKSVMFSKLSNLITCNLGIIRPQEPIKAIIKESINRLKRLVRDVNFRLDILVRYFLPKNGLGSKRGQKNQLAPGP
jgi:hypothetical protein